MTGARKNSSDKISEEQSATVIRNGQNVVISVADVVVGDVVQVKYGDLLPADGMLIASNDLQIDESSLTGESDHVKKSIDKDPSLLAGTHVMEGSGKMIVTAVGPNSASGIIFMLLGAGEEQKIEANEPEITEKSPLNGDIELQNTIEKSESINDEDQSRSILQRKLDKLTVQVTYMGMFFMIATILVLILRLVVSILMASTYTSTVNGNSTTYSFEDQNNVALPPWKTNDINATTNGEYIQTFSECKSEYFGKVMSFFIIGITVLVVAVPEGLPLAVTISLAYFVKK